MWLHMVMYDDWWNLVKKCAQPTRQASSARSPATASIMRTQLLESQMVECGLACPGCPQAGTYDACMHIHACFAHMCISIYIYTHTHIYIYNMCTNTNADVNLASCGAKKYLFGHL